MRTPPLLPLPRDLEWRQGALELPAVARVAGDPGAAALDRLRRALARSERALERTDDASTAAVVFQASSAAESEAYRLDVSPERALVVGRPAGLAHGASTLAQLLIDSGPRGALSCLRIDDWPSLARRGAMLDVSRDRVPSMETLFELVELLAGWKLNELELYCEHVFAYEGHEEVWRDASPLTPDEVRALDGFCRARGIELVPNQQCFGHMHRWLRHARYRELAEVPEGLPHPFSREIEPFSLCATDPRALALVEDLFRQLLPCFTSGTVNAGMDEIFDLGLGRSRAACAERGTGRVYLDYLRAVAELAAAHGKRVQFWADVILRHPELVRELPRGATPLLWGYEASHPFEAETKVVAASGLPFYVCPGTSSWQSFAGRTDNMLANVASAVRHGVSAGALGLLVTDWGDRGHLQPLPVSYAGFAHAADLAWNADAAEDGAQRLRAALDRFAFDDEAGAAAHVALELGRVEPAVASGAVNGTAPFFVLAMIDEPLPLARAPKLSADGIARGLGQVARARAGLGRLRIRRPDAALVEAELAFCADLVALGLELGAARLAAGALGPIDAIPTAVRAELAARLAALVEEHRRLWLARGRPGGLDDSAGWLVRALRRLQP